ncbi:hypothetical protein HB770_04105 [Rhizobium leguminosarum bv. viciae]|uniref:Uncharacterized protein n=1 Tax=Rhizobium leguminosarum bv. viciae TaxID=387 RepID=A0A7G6RHU7_RHILV|nr:hypothetical protein HB770_04105 [Rhizobium leguminosarum bv. viciae]
MLIVIAPAKPNAIFAIHTEYQEETCLSEYPHDFGILRTSVKLLSLEDSIPGDAEIIRPIGDEA